MNDKKPLVDFRSAPKLQTSLILSGALIGFFGAQGGIPTREEVMKELEA